MSKKIVIGTSAVLLTFRCNLRCKLCCTTTPQMAPKLQKDFSLEQLEKVLDRYFSVVSYIRKLSFGGGEPTLHRELPKLIEYTAQFRNQFEVLEIITNGAAIPSKDILNMAEKHRDIIFFMIDDYGKVSSKAKELSMIFQERGIRHTVRCYHGSEAHSGGWVDLGDFSHKHSSEDAMGLLRKCVISGKEKSHTAVEEELTEWKKGAFFIPYAANTNGLIHRCARAFSTLQAGAIGEDSQCFVNIMDASKSTEDLQDEIIQMFSCETYKACEYCNGFDDTSKRYEPAEQI